MNATKLREARKKHGMTLEAVGKKIGTSKQAVSQWENGVSVPCDKFKKELSILLEVPLDIFFEEE